MAVIVNATALASEAVGNATRAYSPVVLNNDWSKLGRLLFMVFCSCLGTTMNGFFVAAFFVEHTLKRAGNVFLACIGLADLIVTTAVMPVSTVLLLSGAWDTIQVCQTLQYLTEAATYSYSLFFMLVAIETYYRLCESVEEYEMFLTMRVGLVSTMVFAICFSIAGVGVYMDLDYDYCDRTHYGNVYFKLSTFAVFHGIPFIITTIGLLVSSISIRNRARNDQHYKRSQQYETDGSTTILNIIAYLLYVVMWIPYLVVVHEYPGTSDAKYYQSAWCGLFRSVIASILYSVVNRNFRTAYAHIFSYCCCKSSLTGTYNRQRRTLEYTQGGDVRVHIMHQAVYPGSPARAAAIRETQEL